MNDSTREIKTEPSFVEVDMVRESSCRELIAKQGDINTRDFIVGLTVNGSVFEIPDGTTARYAIEKPYITAIWNDCEKIEGNRVYGTFTSAAIDTHGIFPMHIELWKDGEKYTSANFSLRVLKSARIADEQVGKNEYSVLDNLIYRSDNSIKDLVEKTEDYAELRQTILDEIDEMNTLESNVASAESKRVEAENKRVSAEKKRQEDTAKAINDCNDATNRANASSDKADSATDAAIKATQNANEKASLANQAAENANNATSLANDATSKAIKATENANAATKNANDAAQNANSKASSANQAAIDANAAADRANKIAEDLEGISETLIDDNRVTENTAYSSKKITDLLSSMIQMSPTEPEGQLLGGIWLAEE